MAEEDNKASNSRLSIKGEEAGIFRAVDVLVSKENKKHTVPVTGSMRPDIPDNVKPGWQRMLSMTADTLGFSSGCVMEVSGDGIRVFLVSGEEREGYAPGCFFPFGSGSSSETVLGLNSFTLLDTEDGGSYVGIPVHWDDGSFFGSICFLNREKITDPKGVLPLILEIRDSMEKDLVILCLRQNRNEEYKDYAKAMETILRFSPGGIFSYSAEEDDEFAYISSNMLALLGYTKEEFTVKFNNRFSQMVYEEDRARTLNEIVSQIRIGPFDRVEYRIEKKDGSLAWVHDEGHIVTDESGRKWFYVVIVDITATVLESEREKEKIRQQAELEKVKTEAEHDRRILDSILDGISVLRMDETGHLSADYLNIYVYQMLGFNTDGAPQRAEDAKDTPYEALFTDALTLVHPDDKGYVRKEFISHKDDKTFTLKPYRMYGKSGSCHWILERVRAGKSSDGRRIFYGAFHDITEEVSLQAQVHEQLEVEKQLRRKADSSNEAKSDFLSRISHDIRTPLNGIIGMTYLAKDEKNPPRTMEYLSKIDTSSKFLLGLINDVLDMSRVESNRIRLHLEPYPLSEFKDYLEAVIRPLCSEKDQKFIFEEGSAQTQYVPLADKLRTNQIFFNLLSNAVKYTPEGGSVTYRISGRMTGKDRVAIDHEIIDNGIGMSESFQKVLFEPFSQEGRDDNAANRGTGLGLAIVKKLVELMHGSISVKSRLGEGTAFRVHLEFDAVPAESLKENARDGTLSENEENAVRGKHILICEDHPMNQEIVKALLEKYGAIVKVAGNGERGVYAFSMSPNYYYDVILMDLRMPVMDGFAAARTIRGLKRADALTIPIFAMSADAFTEDVQKCMDAGMNGHIAKPIEVSILFKTLGTVLK